MIKAFFKKRKIRQYAKKLSLALKQQYGYQRYYSQKQVDMTLKRKRLGNTNNTSTAVNDNCYAYAMYCSRETFTDIHRVSGVTCNYDEMRGEVANIVFGHHTDFTVSSLLAYSNTNTESTASYFSGSSHGGSDGGSDSGGSDGGGGGGGGD